VSIANSRRLLQADVALRLGARPVLLAAWARSPLARWQARRRLALLADPSAVRAAPGDHGPFDPNAQALTLDLFSPGDVRPVWERNRWAELPVLALAQRDDSVAGETTLAAVLAEWRAGNPAFRGPNWACGQEAALRALHLALAMELLGARPANATDTLRRHAARIAATPAYAQAQDNNHPISEAAGLLVCGLLLGESAWVATGHARLERSLVRLIAPGGAFAQLSTGYHRLLLDVAAVTEWLRRRHGGPALSAAAMSRLAAATGWLAALTDRATGATPRLGHQDGSCFADLSGAGPDDARGSIERAARLFAGNTAGFPADVGCAALGLGCPDAALAEAAAPEGVLVRREGAAWAMLRTGPLRFRPGHADLLHLDLWDGTRNVLRDGGTGAYNPPPEDSWWHAYFTGTAAHNTVAFDDRDQMPRVGRFLFAQWPATGALPEGAWLRDHRGCRHARTVLVAGRRWTIEDRLDGPFRTATLRWRLADDAWRQVPDGVTAADTRIRITADALLTVSLESGWVSPTYGVVVRCPVLVARAAAPVSHLTTTIVLP